MLLLPFPVELWTLSNSSKKMRANSEKEMRAFAKFIRPVLAVLAALWRWEKHEREEEKLLRANSGGKWKMYDMHSTKFLYLMKSLCSLSPRFLSLFSQFHFPLNSISVRVLSFSLVVSLFLAHSCFACILSCGWARASHWAFGSALIHESTWNFSLYIRRQSIDSHPCAIVLRDSQTNTFIHYTKRTRIMIFSSRLWVFYESENQARESEKKRTRSDD